VAKVFSLVNGYEKWTTPTRRVSYRQRVRCGRCG